MLTIQTAERALELIESGEIIPTITEQTGITAEDASAIHYARFTNNTEQLFRELQLADVLELAAAKLRSGNGLSEETTGDLFREILHVYPSHLKKAIAMAMLSGKS